MVVPGVRSDRVGIRVRVVVGADVLQGAGPRAGRKGRRRGALATFLGAARALGEEQRVEHGPRGGSAAELATRPAHLVHLVPRDWGRHPVAVGIRPLKVLVLEPEEVRGLVCEDFAGLGGRPDAAVLPIDARDVVGVGRDLDLVVAGTGFLAVLSDPHRGPLDDLAASAERVPAHLRRRAALDTGTDLLRQRLRRAAAGLRGIAFRRAGLSADLDLRRDEGPATLGVDARHAAGHHGREQYAGDHDAGALHGQGTATALPIAL